MSEETIPTNVTEAPSVEATESAPQEISWEPDGDLAAQREAIRGRSRDSRGRFVAQPPVTASSSAETQEPSPPVEAVEEPAQTPEPNEWQQKYNQLQSEAQKYQREMQQWMNHYFPSRESFDEYVTWKNRPQEPAQALEPETEDLFDTVDSLRAWKQQAEQDLQQLRDWRSQQNQDYWVNVTRTEAEQMASKYPAVANPQGREMMFQVYLATMENGGTMEQAAQRIQGMVGTPQATPPAPVQETAPPPAPPTTIPRGRPGQSVVDIQEQDQRETDWYSGNSDGFDAIRKDTMREFGYRN